MKMKPEPFRERTTAIFRELIAERTDELSVAIPKAQDVARKALRTVFDKQTSFDIAFHLTDWNSDAAFIVAFILFPERFTPKEIRAGVTAFLCHAPNHVAAAAKQFGFPIQDTFDVGALDGCDD